MFEGLGWEFWYTVSEFWKLGIFSSSRKREEQDPRSAVAMGASESVLFPSQSLTPPPLPPTDGITTISERVEGVDPLLQRVRALKMTPPLIKSPPLTESSLTDILVKRPSASSASSSSASALNPKVLLELFSMYREWQEEKAKKINQKQEEIEIKIETADALAVKLLQRFNYSVSSMRSTSLCLAQVQPLQVEVGELKGRLTEIISNCDALCKRIATEGPDTLRSSVGSYSRESFALKDPNTDSQLVPSSRSNQPADRNL